MLRNILVFHKNVQNGFYASISFNNINEFFSCELTFSDGDFLSDWFDNNGWEIHLLSSIIE